MKKKLEADLISIAHRVLQMKNKSDINQLCIETQRLYEKLSILRFVEEHFEGVKPTIGQAEIVEKMKLFFEENHLSEIKPAMTKIAIVTEIAVEEEVAEEKIIEREVVYHEDEDEIVEEEAPSTDVEFNETEPDEEGEGDVLSEDEPTKLDTIGFQPAFELDIEDEDEKEEPKKIEAIQISFDDFFGGDYSDTLFVKLDDNIETPKAAFDFELPKVNAANEDYKEELIYGSSEVKTVSLNDKFSQGVNIDLNDRIGFIKNLFGNSEEDYTRVLNQLITYDNFEEARSFVIDMVKPDYNDWEGKSEYEQRFIEIIEKKFA